MNNLSIRSFKWALLGFSILFLSSCKKDPGNGGLATIKGKVYGYKLDVDREPVDSGYVSGERVYISYGDNTWVDDNVRTSYSGDYAFQWLHKGNYKLWILSDCQACPEPERQIDIKEVTITDRKGTVEVEDLIYYND